jgi:hypothetical protein
VRKRVVAAKRDGALQMRCHVIAAVERAPRQSCVVVIFGNRAVDLDRLVEQLHRGRGVAALERDETEIVQAVGMVRHERQNVPVLPFGFDQRSGLMMSDGGIEQGRRRIRRANGDAERRLGAGRSKTSPLLAAHGFRDGLLDAGHPASEPAKVGQIRSSGRMPRASDSPLTSDFWCFRRSSRKRPDGVGWRRGRDSNP